MAKKSSLFEQDVPSFTFNPLEVRQRTLFDENMPLNELQSSLLNTFTGQTMKMIDVYKKHTLRTRFIKRNYKQALHNLLDNNKIIADISGRRGVFPDDAEVTFL